MVMEFSVENKNVGNIIERIEQYLGVKEDIQAKYQGKEIEIGFNAKYIMDILDNLEENEIKISFLNFKVLNQFDKRKLTINLMRTPV